MSTSPIDQFRISNVGSEIFIDNVNISFSNSALLMVTTVLLSTILLRIALSRASIIPNKLQMAAELSYDFVSGITTSNISNKAKTFSPFIYTLFIFILFGNLLGLVPFGFAFTGHIAVTLTLSTLVLVIATLYGIWLNGFGFLRVFVPSGIPIILMPFIFIIEFISYFAKSLSIAIRLFANIMAGHIMMEVIAGFVLVMGIFGIIPFSVTMILYIFEFMISCLQAYIFTILACLFIDQAINYH